jgi:hypothetical protein
MKFNLTKIASLFLLAFAIIVSGCSSDSDEAPLAVNSLNPTSGTVGTEVTINGQSFAPSAGDNTVTFAGDASATVTSASESQLVVTVPEGAMTGPVTVAVGGQTASSSQDFTVEEGQAELAFNSFSPKSGQVGSEVTITGAGFADTRSGNSVTFSGDAVATVVAASSTELTVEVPEDAQDGPISVEVDGNMVTSSESFTVEGEVPSIYENDLPGNKTIISRDETWSNDTTLTGPHYVLPGVTLMVEPGVTVSFEYHNDDADDVGTIITLPADDENFTEDRPSGRLVAEGNADNPIVFTSERKEVASWGGIILAGEASNNIPGGRGEIEGLSSAVQYGADTDGGESFNDADDSGVISYVQINYAGYSISAGSELQSLTLYSVGSETQIDHVSIFRSVDDGIELFGGTVDVKYMAIVGAQDDTFDWDNGWTGRGQFWVGVQTLPANKGFENDGCAATDECRDLGNGPTSPQIYNVTVWGNDQANGETVYGLHLREQIEGEYKNIVVSNFDKSGNDFHPFYIEEGDNTNDNLTTNGDGTLTLGGNFAFNNANTSEDLPYTNDLGITYADVMFNDAANYDFSLQSGSSALTGGVEVPSDDFFTPVTFSGGVGETGSEDDWTSGATWIKWSE